MAENRQRPRWTGTVSDEKAGRHSSAWITWRFGIGVVIIFAVQAVTRAAVPYHQRPVAELADNCLVVFITAYGALHIGTSRKRIQKAGLSLNTGN